MALPSKLDPRRLLDLLSVARHGSFSGAAEAMNVSQPALSQSIALLEREVGSKVLERSRQGARLNGLGEALVFHAEGLEALLIRAKEELRLRSSGLEGSLLLGITPIAAVGLVPLALENLFRAAPRISVSVTEGLDREIIDMLRRRQLDLVISRVGVGPAFPDLAQEQLFNSDWALIVGANHPLADRTSLKLSELDDVRWALPAGGSAFREQMERVFAGAGIDWPLRSISTNSILAIKSIVMSTDCVSIMAKSLVDVEVALGRLKAIPLDDIGRQHPIGITWRQGEVLAPLAARFVGILRSTSYPES
jgi:LysR family transcriptional regulator of gallate degradation